MKRFPIMQVVNYLGVVVNTLCLALLLGLGAQWWLIAISVVCLLVNINGARDVYHRDPPPKTRQCFVCGCDMRQCVCYPEGD